MPALIERFVLYLRDERKRRPRTIVLYSEVLDDLVAFLRREHGLGSEILVDAMAKADIAKFLSSRTRAGRTPSSSAFNLRLYALRAFHDFLLKEEVIDMDPTSRIEPQKVIPVHPIIPLGLDAMIRFVDAANEGSPAYAARDAAIAEVFLHCSLRVREIVSLDVDQIDFDEPAFLNVRAKGGKVLPSVAFNDVVAAALERYLPLRSPRPGEKALFLSNRSTRMAVRTMQTLVSKCGKRAKIKQRTTPHVLRHSSASEMADIGVPVPTISKHLGHSTTRTTDGYIHAARRAVHQAVDRFGKHVKKRRRELAAARKLAAH